MTVLEIEDTFKDGTWLVYETATTKRLVHVLAGRCWIDARGTRRVDVGNAAGWCEGVYPDELRLATAQDLLELP